MLIKADIKCIFKYIFIKFWNKVRKIAGIGNRYIQIPHQSQDTKWESNKITINITNKSQEILKYYYGETILLWSDGSTMVGQFYYGETI